jgi:hypothetical protein
MTYTKGILFALKQGTELQSEAGLHEIATEINGVPVNIASTFEGHFSDSRPDLAADPEYTISSEEAYANAQRLTACWNACEGVTTIDLDSGHLRGIWKRSADDYKAQRDGLISAIQQTLAENGHLADGDVCTLKGLKDALAAAGVTS